MYIFLVLDSIARSPDTNVILACQQNSRPRSLPNSIPVVTRLHTFRRSIKFAFHGALPSSIFCLGWVLARTRAHDTHQRLDGALFSVRWAVGSVGWLEKHRFGLGPFRRDAVSGTSVEVATIWREVCP